MIDAIFDHTTQVLETSLAVRMMRQGMLAANIANAETPNYRASDINFPATMASLLGEARQAEAPRLELRRDDARHFSIAEVRSRDQRTPGAVRFIANDTLAIGNDSNTVSLEAELARLHWNATLYSVMAQLLSHKLSGISDIIESTARY